MPSFDTLQKSQYSGKVLEFYKFANDTDSFRYSSSTETITYNDETYLPFEVSRQRVSQTSNLDKAGLAVTMKRSAPLVLDYLRRRPVTPYWLTLFRVHFGETEVKQLWQGRVMTMETQPDGEYAEFKLESILTALNRLGLQKEFQTLCNWTLYDGIGCPVNKAAHARPANVTAITSDTITVSSLSLFIDDWFNGGFIETSDGDQRDIIRSTQSSGLLRVTHRFAASCLQVGDPVTVYDGCMHRWVEDCIGKYGPETNNGEAHGGYPVGGARNPYKEGVQ
jgi:hypothetical protein